MDDDEIARQLHEEWAPRAAASLRRTHPDPQVKAAILRQILNTPRPKRRLHHRLQWWTVTPGRITALGASLATIAAAIVTLTIWPAPPKPSQAATPKALDYKIWVAATTATDLLQQAATAAQTSDSAKDGTVEYIHTEEWNLNTRIGHDTVTSAVIPNEKQLWRGPHDTAVVIEQYRPPQFPNDDAKQAWEDDGSPGANTTPTRTTYPPGTYELFWHDRPPIQPQQLRTWLAHQHNVTDDAQLLMAIVDLLKSRVLTGPERATTLQLIAQMPTLEYTGTVIDRASRPGQAFSTTSTFSGQPTRYTIIILSNVGLEGARRNTHTIARFLASQNSKPQQHAASTK